MRVLSEIFTQWLFSRKRGWESGTLLYFFFQFCLFRIGDISLKKKENWSEKVPVYSHTRPDNLPGPHTCPDQPSHSHVLVFFSGPLCASLRIGVQPPAPFSPSPGQTHFSMSGSQLQVGLLHSPVNSQPNFHKDMTELPPVSPNIAQPYRQTCLPKP